MRTLGLGRNRRDPFVTAAGACASAAMGFELLAERTRDGAIGVAARNAAACLRGVIAGAVTAAEAYGVDARPRHRTGERLRWEWLASTATVVDGAADERILAECARILAAAVETVGPGDQDREESENLLCDRLRLASAEAFSLSHVVALERRADLLVSPLAWGS
jgi:hypothetical protein